MSARSDAANKAYQAVKAFEVAITLPILDYCNRNSAVVSLYAASLAPVEPAEYAIVSLLANEAWER